MMKKFSEDSGKVYIKQSLSLKTKHSNKFAESSP